MSLIRPIVRQCAVAALRGNTWAGMQVYDSSMTPFADAIVGQAAAPYVVVYTDTDDRMGFTDADIYNGDYRNLNLVIEMGIASATQNVGGGAEVSGPTLSGGMNDAAATGSITFNANPLNGDNITINGVVITFIVSLNPPGAYQVLVGATLPITLGNLITTLNQSTDAALMACSYLLEGNTLVIAAKANGVAGDSISLAASISTITIQFSSIDQGIEMAVDMLEAQVLWALWGNPNSVWGNMLKKFFFRLRRLPSRRGGQAGQGVRFAARRTSFIGTTIDDLPLGVPPAGVWQELLTLAAASDPALGVTDGIAAIAKMMSATSLPSWRQAQAYMGMSTESIKALMADTPLPWAPVEVPPLDWTDANNEFPPPLTDVELNATALPDTDVPLPLAKKNPSKEHELLFPVGRK